MIVKHANPCGVAIGNSILDAYDRAYKTDPTSAFGGIIAFNRELDAETAQAIISRQFVEVIIAPSASEEALKITAAKTERTRSDLRSVGRACSGPRFQTRERRSAGSGS